MTEIEFLRAELIAEQDCHENKYVCKSCGKSPDTKEELQHWMTFGLIEGGLSKLSSFCPNCWDTGLYPDDRISDFL